jgi:Uma2 family endonuclease
MDEHTDKKVWTYEELVALDEPRNGKKWEIFDGELVVSPSPGSAHQLVAKRLVLALVEQIEKRGHGTVLFAPLDVILSRKRVVQPDLLVLSTSQSEIIAPHGIVGPPALAIEIVSPTNAAHDRVRKRRFYARAAIPEYWIVDRTSAEICVLELVSGGLSYRQAGWYAAGDTIKSPTFELAISVNDVFGLPDQPPDDD